MKCPKCNYTRNSEEDVPDWQCPNCGVAYNKMAVNRAELKAKNLEYINKKNNAESFKGSFDIYICSLLFLMVLGGNTDSKISSFVIWILTALCLLLVARTMVVTEHGYGSLMTRFHRTEKPFMFKVEVYSAYALALGAVFLAVKCLLI